MSEPRDFKREYEVMLEEHGKLLLKYGELGEAYLGLQREAEYYGASCRLYYRFMGDILSASMRWVEQTKGDAVSVAIVVKHLCARDVRECLEAFGGDMRELDVKYGRSDACPVGAAED